MAYRLALSMTPNSAIQKGKLLEQHISDRVRYYGLDSRSRRTPGSGNGHREKADIDTSFTILGRTAGIEAKNHAVLHIQEWWRQAEKLEVLGREPVLAFKLYRDPLEASKVVIYLDTFLALVKAAGEPKVLQSANHEQKYNLKQLIAYAKKVLNELDS